MLSKITDAEREGKGVTGLPDTPELTTTQMQQQFDSLGNLSIEGHNRLVDELTGTIPGTTGADNISASVPEGIVASQNIQSILAAIGALVVTQGGVAHTHDNKAVIDAITVETKINYDRIATMLNGILSVEQNATNTPESIPSSAAVYRLLSDYSFAELKLALYPIGTVYFSHNAVSPETFIGGSWSRETLIDGVLSWRRTA